MSDKTASLSSRHPRADSGDSRGGRFHQGLNAAARERLWAISSLREFRKGATIAVEESDLGFVGNVVAGVVKMQKTLPDGRQQIVGLLVPNDILGHVFEERISFSAEAATDVALCCYERRRFEALMGEIPNLEQKVLLAILDELEAAREWMTMMNGNTVAARFAGFLLMLCHRWPEMCCDVEPGSDRLFIRVPIGRGDLARYLGTTPESISRSAMQLARRGVLDNLTPSRFRVRDLDALLALAQGGGTNAADFMHRLRGDTSRRDIDTTP